MPYRTKPGSFSNLPGIGEHGHEHQHCDTLEDAAVHEFREATANPSTPVAVAAIRALTLVIKLSTSSTVMGLSEDLQKAAAALKQVNPSSIAGKAGSELFVCYCSGILSQSTRDEREGIEVLKKKLISRGQQFEETSKRARSTIAELGARFIRTNATVLTHGFSRVVLTLLKRAVAQVATSALRDHPGVHLQAWECSWKVRAHRGVELVLIGAEAVVENGGVINKLGSYQTAICAKVLNKPVYVAVESYKFARLYPLGQRDLPEERKACDLGPLLPSKVTLENPSRDYTPPNFISGLITDLGVLTPAAVSDELIQLYEGHRLG
ncbi:eukaryotic initiation factor [Dunaliella salina]|uniref:Translation initiation factor eIF2B subunit alpha n=1 Tax=Dunaliella salina TaxID=3046 RepID=A0ABQ7GHA2_DUNSA|nr:eukaryotic initiation factor [Dunaliella salina]|eukprot:KAF5833942.1 eukaryotic initiation factor [Dunaliella salina]